MDGIHRWAMLERPGVWLLRALVLMTLAVPAMVLADGIGTSPMFGPKVVNIPLTKIPFDTSKTLLKVFVDGPNKRFEIVARCISSYDGLSGVNEFDAGERLAYALVKNVGVENAATDVATPDNDWLGTDETEDSDDKHHFNDGEEQRIAVSHQPPADDTTGDISSLDRASIISPKGVWLSFENFYAAINLFGHTGCEFGGMLSIGAGMVVVNPGPGT